MGIVCAALSLYTLILFVRIILSWVTMAWAPPPALSPAIEVIYRLTEPVMGFFRRYIPPMGGLDLSPLVIFLLISVIQRSIC
ncbi:MAG: YggT family protein [Actinomycetota bacterium]